MCLAVFAAVIALFDILFRIVPCAAAAGHCDTHEQAGDDAADEHATKDGRSARERGYCDDCDDGEQRGNDHFLERCLCDDVHAGAVIRLFVPAFHKNAGLCGNLAADFGNHRASCASHRAHAECAEHVGEQTADKEPDHHAMVVE